MSGGKSSKQQQKGTPNKRQSQAAPPLERQKLWVHKKGGGQSVTQLFVPLHGQRAIIKEMEEFERDSQIDSDRLYDDNEMDMYSKKLEAKKKAEQERLDKQTFGQYVGNQIDFFFDSTNIKQVVQAAQQANQIGVKHRLSHHHRHTKSTESNLPPPPVKQAAQGKDLNHITAKEVNLEPSSYVHPSRRLKSAGTHRSTLKTTKTGMQRALEYSTYAAMAQGGGDIDPELSRLYSLLNRDCKMINQEKKNKIVRRSQRKGISIDEKQVNLLQMEGNPLYESVATTTSVDTSSSSEAGLGSDDGDLLERADNVTSLTKKDSGFGLRLKRLGYSSGQGSVPQNSCLEQGKEDDSSEDDDIDEYNSQSSIMDDSKYALRRKSPVQDVRLPLRQDDQDSFHTSSSIDWEKKRRTSMRKLMKKSTSDVSVIHDIVKRKQITFLKSSNLFAQEDELFGGGASAADGQAKQTRPGSPGKVYQEEVRRKNQKLIKKNLDDKKKIEGAIEKMSVGGDRLVLDTIGRQIQFAKEKEFIYKLLIGQAMGASSTKKSEGGSSPGGAPQGAPNEAMKNMILNQLRYKQDSHQNVMALLIEKVLSDDETRERLLDQSVLNDFYFEEKMRERRLQVIQEQQRNMAKMGNKKRKGGMSLKDFEFIELNLGNEVLDSLQHLPEVIRPEHIKVNISGTATAEKGNIVGPKEKDNIYHRSIVKKAIQANLNSNKLKMQRFSNLQIINYILHYTTAQSKAEAKAAQAAQTYSTIVNLRKVYAYTATLNSDKFGHGVNFSKWITLTKQLRGHLKENLLIDTVDLEKIFYEIVKNQSPSEMSFEDFVEGLRALSRKLAKALVRDASETTSQLMANEDELFNRFLTDVLKPIFDENKSKEVPHKFESSLVQHFFVKSHTGFFQKLFLSFKEYPLSSSDDAHAGGGGQNSKQMFNPLTGSSGVGEEENNTQGVVLSQVLDVMRVLQQSPEILQKSEVHSLFMQSLTVHDALSYADFLYFLFSFWHTVQVKVQIFTTPNITHALRHATFLMGAGSDSHGKPGVAGKHKNFPDAEDYAMARRLQEFFMTPKLNEVELNKRAQETTTLNAPPVVVTFGGEVALERIKEQHNEIILAKMSSKSSQQPPSTAFGKHYSVNIRPNIM